MYSLTVLTSSDLCSACCSLSALQICLRLSSRSPRESADGVRLTEPQGLVLLLEEPPLLGELVLELVVLPGEVTEATLAEEELLLGEVVLVASGVEERGSGLLEGVDHQQ